MLVTNQHILSTISVTNLSLRLSSSFWLLKIFKQLFFFLKVKRVPDVIFSEVTMYRTELGLLPAHDDVERTERQRNRPVISSTSGERPVLGSSPVPLNKIFKQNKWWIFRKIDFSRSENLSMAVGQCKFRHGIRISGFDWQCDYRGFIISRTSAVKPKLTDKQVKAVHCSILKKLISVN